MKTSLSEDNGIAALSNDDLKIYSLGISTAGLAEMRMAKLLPGRQITATTIDCAGAQFVQQLVEQKGLSKQITVKLEDVREPLPYEKGHFDFIYARLVLHYLPESDLNHALDELHRILKTHGKLFVVVRSSQSLQRGYKSMKFDPKSRLTTYTYGRETFRRLFHSEKSIQEYLVRPGFAVQHVKSYKEHICEDFFRKIPAQSVDTVIESLAVRTNPPTS